MASEVEHKMQRKIEMKRPQIKANLIATLLAGYQARTVSNSPIITYDAETTKKIVKEFSRIAEAILVDVGL